jgi:hypothetical protein
MTDYAPAHLTQKGIGYEIEGSEGSRHCQGAGHRSGVGLSDPGRHRLTTGSEKVVGTCISVLRLTPSSIARTRRPPSLPLGLSNNTFGDLPAADRKRFMRRETATLPIPPLFLSNRRTAIAKGPCAACSSAKKMRVKPRASAERSRARWSRSKSASMGPIYATISNERQRFIRLVLPTKSMNVTDNKLPSQSGSSRSSQALWWTWILFGLTAWWAIRPTSGIAAQLMP